MVIFYLMLRFLVFDAYNLYSSSYGQYCPELAAERVQNQCIYSLSGFNLKSSANQSNLNVLDILSLLFTILAIIYFIIFRRLAFTLVHWLEYVELSEETFTAQIQNIPRFIFEADTTKRNVSFNY
jgi:hypothetical protein